MPYKLFFQVLQAAWRWLWDSKNRVDMKDRQRLLGIVKSMVYAKTQESLDDIYEEAVDDRETNQGFLKYLERVYARRQLWAVCYREELPTQITIARQP